MLSASEAAKAFGYTGDYVARLARQGKIKAGRIGRQWFVDPTSLEYFVNRTQQSQKKRIKNIRLERKAERKQATEIQEPLSVRAKVLSQKIIPGAHVHAPQVSALFQAGAVMASGLLFALVLQSDDAELLVRGMDTQCQAHSSCVAAVTYGLESFGNAVYEEGGRIYGEATQFVDSFETFDVDEENVLAHVGMYLHVIDASLTQFSHTIAFHLGLSTERTVVLEDASGKASEGVVFLKEKNLGEGELEDIKNSFADEVRIDVDPEDPETGIVTPIFKERTGEAYRFLMVPLNRAQE